MAVGCGRAIVRNLKLCQEPMTYVLCAASYESSDRDLFSAPRRCNTMGPRDGFAGAANLTRLKWRGWSRSVATARGVARGYKLPLQKIPVRVRAYRRRECPSGDCIYTRLSVRSRYGTTVVRFPASCSA